MDFEFDFNAVQENAYCFLFSDDELLVEEAAGDARIPLIRELKALNIRSMPVYYAGELDGNAYYAATWGESLPEGFSSKKVRQVYGQIEEECYWLMLRGLHIVNWTKTNRFCGCCGGLMKVSSHELAVKCSECGYTAYPRISPAVIVAVVKDDKILLAHSNRFPPGRYSVIAGFVEPGEALEDCVAREIKEEVGIDVTDICYFGSQPWPFPDSLMVAFTARWSAGTITIDNKEIADANWYSAGNLPNLPPKDSIARRLIDWFANR
jgi:NAD+ diphosphatase